jgi:cell division septation protein DedD
MLGEVNTMTAITLNLPDFIVQKLKAMPNADEFATEILTQKFVPLPDSSHKKGDILDFVNARIAEQKADPEGAARLAKEMQEELEASRNSWSEGIPS